MSPNAYLFLHLCSVILVMLGFGALIARAALAPENSRIRKLGSIVSGVGLLLLLVSGFGLLAKVHQNQFYNWVLVKIVIWVIFGAMTTLINKQPRLSMPLFWVTFLLGVAAAYLGVFQPF